MNQQTYHRLVSGQSKSLAAAVVRLLLTILSWFYRLGVCLRNFLYSAGLLKTHRVNAAVISVGNITVGGTGKTPLVIWLSRFLAEKNIHCAILTRGYKTRKSKLTDEPAILAKGCPDAEIIVNPDRVAAAREAIQKSDIQVVLMDDGFQHRRLKRDLDIVTIDAMRPFGYGRVLPAGLLREPAAALKRAHAAVVTRCDLVGQDDLTQIENKIRQINPDIVIARSIHSAVCAKSTGPKQFELEQLRDRKIFAFCGIGNPDAFFGTIQSIGLNLLGSQTYNDHHCYTRDCLTDICEEATYLNADMILTTQKDWTKTALLMPLKDIPLAYLAIELRLLTGKDQLINLIEEALAGRIQLE